MGFFSIIVFIISFVISLIVWGFLTIIWRYVENKWLKRKIIPLNYNRKTRITILILISLYSGFDTYRAFYPLKRFYFNEWEFFTNTELSKSTEVLQRAADYPDFHGDYCSCALFKLDTKNYLSIKNYFLADSSYFDTISLGSSVYWDVLEKSGYSEKDFPLNRGRWDDNGVHHLEFMDDRNLILLHGCFD